MAIGISNSQLGGTSLSWNAIVGASRESVEPHRCGHETQLYRQDPSCGEAWNGIDPPDSANHAATSTWSRDNGSVVFSIVSLEGTTIALEYLGQDARSDLEGDRGRSNTRAWCAAHAIR
ncbi:MAG: DUF6519 domain-containing protein [Solirubrobacteraceae bacterium]